MDWYPLRFEPLYKERVWGGARLANFYGRNVGTSAPVGESWEISDRPEGVSRVAGGPWAGRSISEILAASPNGLLGDATARDGRFPLLVKILDSRESLSLQVHPPPSQAARLGGESKTEMWYVTGTEPASCILAGLRAGVSRDRFEEALRLGSVADCFHRIPVSVGDAMFLPSGRVHALGAGVLLFEVQENSDTTYRVHDWNRLGLDGKPRPLHVREALECIDFADPEPALIAAPWREEGPTRVRSLVEDPLFRVEVRQAPAGVVAEARLQRCRILGVATGELRLCGGAGSTVLGPGDFCLLPAGLETVRTEVRRDAEWLMTEPGIAHGGGH